MAEPIPPSLVLGASVCPTCGAPVGATGGTASAVPAEPGLMTEALAQLAHACPPLTPPPGVKARLLARIQAAQTPPVRPVEPPPEVGALWRFASIHTTEGWLRPPVPGVRLKELSVDVERGMAFLMVEIAPGRRFPDHVHRGAEFGLVLTGDVTSGGRLLRAGDYYHTAAGSAHTEIVSPNGCTALLAVNAEAWRDWRSAFLVPAT